MPDRFTRGMIAGAAGRCRAPPPRSSSRSRSRAAARPPGSRRRPAPPSRPRPRRRSRRRSRTRRRRRAIVWGLERPARAARRLRAHPAVAAATPVGRGASCCAGHRRGRAGRPARPLRLRDPARHARRRPVRLRRHAARGRSGSRSPSCGRARRSSRPPRRPCASSGPAASCGSTSGALRVVGVVRTTRCATPRSRSPRATGAWTRCARTVIVSLRADGLAARADPPHRARRGRADRRRRRRRRAPRGPPQLKVMLRRAGGRPALRRRLDPPRPRASCAATSCTRRVPILGTVTCHREMIPPLRARARRAPPPRPVAARRPRRLRGLPRAAPDPAARPALAARVGRGDRPQRLRQPVHGPLAPGPPARPDDGAARASRGAATGRRGPTRCTSSCVVAAALP